MIPIYIDPGTGSMLFSLFIGLAAALSFGLRALVLKLKFVFSGGKVDASAEEKNRIPYVIFSDHKRYWNIFKPICDEFERRGIDLVFYTASPDDPALEAGYEHVRAEYLGEGNRPYAKLNMLHADILMATTPNLDVYQWKRSRYVKFYVHIPHTVDISSYRMFALDHYDAVMATGENMESFVRKIESLRPSIARKDVKRVGCLELDELKKKKDSYQSRREKTRPIVLVAPSWGKSAILSKYGDKLLGALARTDYQIIVRPHPQSIVSEQEILRPLTEKYSSIEWNYDNDNFDVLSNADIMITDFSGIIFDYSLVFDKPVIYADTSFDTLPYDADWLDEPMWSFKVLPEFGIQLKESQFENIGEVISKALESKDLHDELGKVRSECWDNIGHCAEATVDYIVAKEQEISSR